MKRQKDDMQVNVAGLRRNLKNLAHNYSDAQKKVREATSNDPWGPSSTLMAEVADLTYNVVAFSEIMQMIWKRLNDHGRNWRHVYKALVLLEYLIKTGTEKVGQQCKDNIVVIQTLKDFQYLEEGKDQGLNVREKAKQLVILLKDEERLRNERARALKAKERFAQTASGFGSDGGLDTPTSPKYPPFSHGWNTGGGSGELPRELEVARPQTVGEEELQLQLALAMSREEAEQDEQKRRSDDVRLQLALSQSQQDFKTSPDKPQSHMQDLLDINLADPTPAAADPWGMPQPPRPQTAAAAADPWRSAPVASPPPPDPWLPASAPSAAAVASATASPKPDPWATGPPVVPPPTKRDPWSPGSQSSPSTDLDEFDIITNRNRAASPKSNGTHSSNKNLSDPYGFKMNMLYDPLPAGPSPSTSPKSNGAHSSNNNLADPFKLNSLYDPLAPGPSPSTGATKKTPHSFLGENSALVNLDNLVASKPATNPSNTTVLPYGNTANPFSETSRPVFQPVAPPRPTMNQIKQQPPFGNPPAPVAQDPWAPVSTSPAPGAPWMKPLDQPNPFLS